MQRRQFLKVAGSGIAVVAVGSQVPRLLDHRTHPAAQTVDLSLEEALVEMVDGRRVFHWVFASAATGPSFPGPVIHAIAGDDVTISVTNNLGQPHAFQIVGTDVTTGPIDPGRTTSVRFPAPAAGTYLYADPLNEPVNRVLGLHGAFVVSPAAGTTPYSAPTPAVQRLFDDLGTAAHFPRHANSPAGWQPERHRIWLMTQVDPALNDRVQAGETLDPAAFKADFLPRYFTMNGKSGAFAAHDESVVLTGRIGQPLLVRILNAGLFHHSNHLHANHFYVTAVNNVVQDNVFFLDTFTIGPGYRVDWLVPYLRPPDIAGDPNVPLRELIPHELALTIPDPRAGRGVPQSPLVYPMHCHMETSQTAAGGNYPQGAVTHMEFLGDVDGVDFPDARHA